MAQIKPLTLNTTEMEAAVKRLEKAVEELKAATKQVSEVKIEFK